MRSIELFSCFCLAVAGFGLGLFGDEIILQITGGIVVVLSAILLREIKNGTL